MCKHNDDWPLPELELLAANYSYVAMLVESGRFVAAETFWQKHLPRAQNATRRAWIEDELRTLYNTCLEHRGTVSLGSGETLFSKLIVRDEQRLAVAQFDQARFTIVEQMAGTLSIAKRRRLIGAQWQTRKFAFETLPAALSKQQDNYSGMLQNGLRVVSEVLDEQLALQFLIERMEQYPDRVALTSPSAWSQFGEDLGSAPPRRAA